MCVSNGCWGALPLTLQIFVCQDQGEICARVKFYFKLALVCHLTYNVIMLNFKSKNVLSKKKKPTYISNLENRLLWWWTISAFYGISPVESILLWVAGRCFTWNIVKQLKEVQTLVFPGSLDYKDLDDWEPSRTCYILILLNQATVYAWLSSSRVQFSPFFLWDTCKTCF